jgi:hypothetical protein
MMARQGADYVNKINERGPSRVSFPLAHAIPATHQPQDGESPMNLLSRADKVI